MKKWKEIWHLLTCSQKILATGNWIVNFRSPKCCHKEEQFTTEGNATTTVYANPSDTRPLQS